MEQMERDREGEVPVETSARTILLLVSEKWDKERSSSSSTMSHKIRKRKRMPVYGT